MRYDVFISYAVEDKQTVAEPIVRGLRQKDLRVYFVGELLATGELVSEIVHRGLEESEYFVLILSPDYIRKWPIIERSTIIRREQKEGRILAFPVWHNISEDLVKLNSPELVDRWAVSTDKGLSVVAEEIYSRVVKANKKKWRGRIFWSLTTLVVGVFVLAAIYPLLANRDNDHFPSEGEVETLVNARISEFEQVLENDLAMSRVNGSVIQLDSVTRDYNYFSGISLGSRNDFTFSNGYENLRSRSDIESAGFILAPSPHGAYGIGESEIWRLWCITGDSAFEQVVVFCDTHNTDYAIDTLYFCEQDSLVHVWVSYVHNVRMVYYTLSYSGATRKMKQRVRLLGFKPREEYILSNRTGYWDIHDVK